MNKTMIASLTGLFFTSVFAAEHPLQTTETIVTSSRFSELNATNTGNVTIISKEDILASPASSIPDLLKMQVGLHVTSLYGNQGIDSSVDIRGFGDSGISNTLVLVDGQRMNGVDSSNIQWASIPLAAIDHIEIMSGGGSVLYGDRASGGVINIITDKTGKPAASVTATLGSYAYKALDGFASGSLGDAYFNTFVHTSDRNGWRENTASNSWSISGRGGWCFNLGEGFLDYAAYQISNGTPGNISSTVYATNPRTARTPIDSQTKEGFRLRPGINYKLSDTIEFAAELGLSHEDQHFNNPSSPSLSDRKLNTYSLTPRIKWSHDIGAMKSITVGGLDYYHGEVDGDAHDTYANQSAHQTTRAIYVQNTTALLSNLDLTVGFRRQQAQQNASQTAFAPYGYNAISGHATHYKNAYDLNLNYHELNWNVYAKANSSFRFANTDEVFGFDNVNFVPIFSGNIIKPQYAKNREIGAKFKQGNIDGSLAIYHTRVDNEIGYDATQGSNTNFDPTKHQGVETQVGWQINDQLKAKASYSYTEASFSEGIHQGKALPSVPHSLLNAQLSWTTEQYGQYTAQANYVGQRYASGDFDNQYTKLPSYTTLDLRAKWDMKPIALSLTALNVLDKRYTPYGLYATYTTPPDFYFFPADGRTLYVSATYDFK